MPFASKASFIHRCIYVSGEVNLSAKIKNKELETRYTTLTTVNNELSIIEGAVGYRKESFKLDTKNVMEEIEKINQTFREQSKNPEARLSNEQLNMIQKYRAKNHQSFGHKIHLKNQNLES